LGAQFHPSLVNDLEIFYDLKTLRRLTAVMREIGPEIVLTHSPHDYMEDHTNTCRLAVTAAFARGMPNFKTIPARRSGDHETTVYHAMPHGLRDSLRRRITPGAFVNTVDAHQTKLAALGAQKSQQGWLDASQGMNSYLRTMEGMSREVGKMSKRFKLAEGWRRHLHLGFCAEDSDPLRDALGRNYLVNAKYEHELG
jgi:LmbE family N-acetylglucosaminyl deacetylase